MKNWLLTRWFINYGKKHDFDFATHTDRRYENGRYVTCYTIWILILNCNTSDKTLLKQFLSKLDILSAYAFFDQVASNLSDKDLALICNGKQPLLNLSYL